MGKAATLAVSAAHACSIRTLTVEAASACGSCTSSARMRPRIGAGDLPLPHPRQVIFLQLPLIAENEHGSDVGKQRS